MGHGEQCGSWCFGVISNIVWRGCMYISRGTVVPLSVSRDWPGFKWRPVLKVCEQLQDQRTEERQNAYR